MIQFSDFTSSFPTNSVARGSTTARHIYENVIWREDVRVGFADNSDRGLPALAFCANEIEQICSAPNSDFPLCDEAKKCIGRMVKISIRSLGYTPQRPARMPQNLALAFFKNAKVYRKTEDGTEKIERKIVPR